jgi:hypothetical protein
MSELPGRILGQPEYLKSTEGSVESFVHKKPLQFKKQDTSISKNTME